MHMASQLCAVQALSGTLIISFQPSEENGAGAQAMVDNGLYDAQRFAVRIPDAALAGHTMSMRAGRVWDGSRFHWPTQRNRRLFDFGFALEIKIMSDGSDRAG
jgi:metal-dependent amidase/aminoacylase/carboxypeptidase family protein